MTATKKKLTAAERKAHAAKIKAGLERSQAHDRGEHPTPIEGCKKCALGVPAKTPAQPGDVRSSEGVSSPIVPDEVTTADLVPGSPLPPPPPSPDFVGSLRSDPNKPEDAREAEHQQALQAAMRADAEAKVSFPVVGDPDGTLVFHVLVDGFTVLGKVHYRGEEIRVREGSDTWKLTLDANGRPFFDVGEEEQKVRYGQVMFRAGPWPHATMAGMTEDDYQSALASDDREAIRRYEKARAREAIPASSAAPVAARGV